MGVKSNHPGMDAIVALALQSPRDFAQGRALAVGSEHVESHPHLLEEFNNVLGQKAGALNMPLATITNVINAVVPGLVQAVGGLAAEQGSQSQGRSPGLGYNTPERAK